MSAKATPPPRATAWSRASGRVFYRLHKGIYELFTFPFPTVDGSYKPPYKSNVPWIHGGYEEFPPELGWNTRRRYTTTGYAGW